MRKAILAKFVQVLLAALILNSVIFYVVSSSMMLKTSRKNMLYTLETIDSILDYEKGLPEQIEKMAGITGVNHNRLTLIYEDGTVAADTGVDAEGMDNHLEREEVAAALQDGVGYATRHSSTLNQTMLYVACRSAHHNLILRLAVPFSGMREYLPMLLPAAWLSFAVAVLASLSVTDRLVSSVTRPIRDLSNEMMKLRGDSMELHFTPSPYPEINVIGTTTVKMSQNVREYLNQIEKERKIRQEFFSNASHELKTPITSIQGYAELLENDIVTDEAMKKDFIHRIKKEAVHMTSLINDILMISRLEAKEAETAFSQVRVAVVLQDVRDSIEPMAAGQGVFLHTDCPPVSIWANPQQIRELFMNLVSNAVKYNHPGGQVWVTVREQDGQLILKVRDNGMGIPEDSLDRIFERFYRVDKGRSRKQGGTGLGLSIVKHIVNFYHGTIQVHSKMEEGTEFVVAIPMESEETETNTR
ncbi:MAG: ATP-binding protein [Lachnospiraceae bacterium]|nr:ATP-binding protein [Lachnospiraceae bacterium]